MPMVSLYVPEKQSSHILVRRLVLPVFLSPTMTALTIKSDDLFIFIFIQLFEQILFLMTIYFLNICSFAFLLIIQHNRLKQMKLGKRKYEKTQHFPSKVKYYVNVQTVKPIDLSIVVPEKKVINFAQQGVQPLGNIDEVMLLLRRLRTGWQTPKQRILYSKQQSKKSTKANSIFDDCMEEYTVDNNIQDIDIDNIQFLKINDDEQ